MTINPIVIGSLTITPNGVIGISIALVWIVGIFICLTTFYVSENKGYDKNRRDFGNIDDKLVFVSATWPVMIPLLLLGFVISKVFEYLALWCEKLGNRIIDYSKQLEEEYNKIKHVKKGSGTRWP